MIVMFAAYSLLQIPHLPSNHLFYRKMRTVERLRMGKATTLSASVLDVSSVIVTKTQQYLTQWLLETLTQYYSWCLKHVDTADWMTYILPSRSCCDDICHINIYDHTLCKQSHWTLCKLLPAAQKHSCMKEAWGGNHKPCATLITQNQFSFHNCIIHLLTKIGLLYNVKGC